MTPATYLIAGFQCTHGAAVTWQVLGPLLLPEELDIIFGQVSSLFARLLSDAFQRLDPRVRPPNPSS